MTFSVKAFVIAPRVSAHHAPPVFLSTDQHIYLCCYCGTPHVHHCAATRRPCAHNWLRLTVGNPCRNSISTFVPWQHMPILSVPCSPAFGRKCVFLVRAPASSTKSTDQNQVCKNMWCPSVWSGAAEPACFTAKKRVPGAAVPCSIAR